MAKKIIKWTCIGLLVALVLIQFYRPAKNIDPTTPASDITVAYQTPPEITQILHKACYDCHSNNTAYPWYNNFQPVAMWLADHVKDGKDELNFSEYGNFKTKRKLKKLREIVKEVEENEMPLDSYTWIHSEARLTAAEKQLLIEWAKALSTKISMETPVGQ
jgi:exonuclease VII small subunit